MLIIGWDVFVKFQNNFTPRQVEDVGPRYEQANVKFGLVWNLTKPSQPVFDIKVWWLKVFPYDTHESQFVIRKIVKIGQILR